MRIECLNVLTTKSVCFCERFMNYAPWRRLFIWNHDLLEIREYLKYLYTIMENLHVSQKQLSYHRVRGQNFLAVLFVATIFLSSLGYSFESTIGLADLIDDFTSNLTKPSGVPVTKTSTPTSNTSGVKIFQTKQGYTLLICNGYRFVDLSFFVFATNSFSRILYSVYCIQVSWSF